MISFTLRDLCGRQRRGRRGDGVLPGLAPLSAPSLHRTGQVAFPASGSWGVIWAQALTQKQNAILLKPMPSRVGATERVQLVLNANREP